MWIYSNAFFCCCFCWNELNCLLQSFSKLHKTLQWGPLLENLVLLIFKVFWYYWFLNWDFSFCLFFFLFFFLLFFFFCAPRFALYQVSLNGWYTLLRTFFAGTTPCSSAIFQSSWENKIPWKKKTGRRKRFRNKKCIFFWQWHSSAFWLLIPN